MSLSSVVFEHRCYARITDLTHRLDRATYIVYFVVLLESFSEQKTQLIGMPTVTGQPRGGHIFTLTPTYLVTNRHLPCNKQALTL